MTLDWMDGWLWRGQESDALEGEETGPLMLAMEGCPQPAGAMIGFPADDDVGRRLAGPGAAAERNLKRGVERPTGYESTTLVDSARARGPAGDWARPLVGRASAPRPMQRTARDRRDGAVQTAGREDHGLSPCDRNGSRAARYTDSVVPVLARRAPPVHVAGLSGGEGPVPRPHRQGGSSRLAWMAWMESGRSAAQPGCTVPTLRLARASTALASAPLQGGAWAEEI